jgi:hypothetical protein
MKKNALTAFSSNISNWVQSEGTVSGTCLGWRKSMMLVLPVLAAVTGYFAWLWGSVSSFVSAVDGGSVLFEDFGRYYYMSRSILDAHAPISGYFYSAFFAVFLKPISLLEFHSARWVWGIIQGVFLILLFLLPLRKLLLLSPAKLMLYTAVFATSFPILHNFRWGQVSVLLTVCIVAAYHEYESKRPVVAGVILAFAAAIKYYPAIFAVYFIFKRDKKACVSFAVSVILFYIAVPALAMGPQAWSDFEIATTKSLSAAAMAHNANSQYFVHVVFRWFGFLMNSRDSFSSITTEALRLLGYVIVTFNIVFLWIWHRRNKSGAFLFFLTILFLSLPFVLRSSWPHYFSYLPFCQIGLFNYITSSERISPFWKRLLLSLPLLSCFCSSVFAFSLFPDWPAYNGRGCLFIADLLLLVCIYLIFKVERSIYRTPAANLPTLLES